MATARGTDVAAAELSLNAPVIKDSVGPLDEKRAASTEEDHHDEAYGVDIYGANVEFPTDEEIATLRRVADKMPIGAFAIVIVELCERFAYYGE